ncbi:phosphate ABC transporter permease subunit PstC [Sporocytophaga myxococcoides]|uniref:phosphate ABC transporter permease subunit PstC n=1 Tax=Sporocytophaga myxococcoides TaxID=153721 RepID=UPI001B7F85F1|nr:phosphate ABC transporter permease subunit PstC [Sporocytophaga myxococcoides]
MGKIDFYHRRLWIEKLSFWAMKGLTYFSITLLFLILIGLIYKSLPILQETSLGHLFFSIEWQPLKMKFGLLPFIISTLYVTTVAIIISVPLCLLCAIYLSEYADKRIIAFVNPLIDILAGIPSVIFGIWGIIEVVPLVRDFIAPAFGTTSSGYTILTGGIVLSIMIFPIIIHVLLEVFETIPTDLKNASLSVGATKWQTVKFVILRKAAPGVISAVVLGLSRAFGETLALLMVVGNVIMIPISPLDPGYPLTALIANNYGEMMSIPLYDSALMLASLILFVIVLIFNFISRRILKNIERKIA